MESCLSWHVLVVDAVVVGSALVSRSHNQRVPMQALLTETRLLASPPPAVFSEQLATLSEAELATVERLLASSPHNRQVCSVGDTLNAALTLLPRFGDAARRAIALRIIRHLGSHRFTVHNTRFVLAVNLSGSTARTAPCADWLLRGRLFYTGAAGRRAAPRRRGGRRGQRGGGGRGT